MERGSSYRFKVLNTCLMRKKDCQEKWDTQLNSNNVLNTMRPYGVENLRSIIGYLVLTLSMLFFLKMKLCAMNLEHIHKVLVPMRQ